MQDSTRALTCRDAGFLRRDELFRIGINEPLIHLARAYYIDMYITHSCLSFMLNPKTRPFALSLLVLERLIRIDPAIRHSRRYFLARIGAIWKQPLRKRERERGRGNEQNLRWVHGGKRRSDGERPQKRRLDGARVEKQGDRCSRQKSRTPALLAERNAIHRTRPDSPSVQPGTEIIT